MPEPRPKRFIPLSEVERRVNRSRWWIRKEINDGRFPKPVTRKGRINDFVEDEIDSYMNELIAKRDDPQRAHERQHEDA
jgi:predicted DNA-binding transcriptional regulator AlpA